MNRDGGYINTQIIAEIVVGDIVQAVNMVGSIPDGEEDIKLWRMYGPSFCSGDYYPE